MVSIDDLLSRIRWDADFAAAVFRIGYYDRVADTLLYVDFAEIIREPGNRFSFQVMDEDGIAHGVPYHRIREVYRNGEPIWRRPFVAGR